MEASKNRILKGDGTMSASSQNYVYNYGQQRDGKKPQVISKERLVEIKMAAGKYLADKKK